MYHCSVGFQPPLSVSALLYGYARFPISVLFLHFHQYSYKQRNKIFYERYVTLSTCTSESTNGRHLLIGRILENNADEKGEPQYEEK